MGDPGSITGTQSVEKAPDTEWADDLAAACKALIDNWEPDSRAGETARVMRLVPIFAALKKGGRQ